MSQRSPCSRVDGCQVGAVMVRLCGIQTGPLSQYPVRTLSSLAAEPFAISSLERCLKERGYDPVGRE